MNKKNYFNLKNELKELAAKIKSAKQERKLYQQANSGNDLFRKNVTMQNSADILKKWEDTNNKYSLLCDAINEVIRLKREYRHKHIIISMARGKSYNQIESKVREGNEPDWCYIKQLKDGYIFDEVA